MKISTITVIVSSVAFIIWIAVRIKITGGYTSSKMDTINDKPIDFGYKTVWIAVKTGNKQRVAEILGLQNIQPSNWKSGIETAYDDGVYITPQIGQWTLAVGVKLAHNNDLENINKLEKIINQLSTEFGEAQSFGTHRVTEYHHWMKSINGKISRVYSYIGERGENIKVFGELTKPEMGLNLFNSLSEEAKSESYWDREDLVYADEELVMKIAESWSVNPTRLTERKDVEDELGLVGE